jgi:hypothetical protein
MPLWNLLPSAASFVSKAVNKPKPIKMNDKYLKAFTANLRGEKISGDVRQKALEAESKVIGKRTGTALRNIQATEATPAQKTQAVVDLYKKEGEAVGGASDRASRLQEERNVGIDTQRRGVEEYLAKTKDRISMENELREDDWKKDMIGSGVGLLAGGVGQLGQDAYNKKQALQKGFEEAKAGGLIPETETIETYEQTATNVDIADPANYNKFLETGKTERQTTAFNDVLGKFAKTGELPKDFDMETISPEMQRNVATMQAGEDITKRKTIAATIDQSQKLGIDLDLGTPEEPIDIDTAVYNANEKMKQEFADISGFKYNELTFDQDVKDYHAQSSDELSNAMSLYMSGNGTSDIISGLSDIMDTTKDEGDQTKIFNMYNTLSQRQKTAIGSGSMTRKETNAVERAKADLQIAANEIDRVFQDIPITTETEGEIRPLNQAIREVQELIRSDAQVSKEQFQQIIDTLKDASANLPQTMKEKFLREEGFDPEASLERFQNIWTNKISKELSKNLAATGRLTETIDPFAEFEVN